MSSRVGVPKFLYHCSAGHETYQRQDKDAPKKCAVRECPLKPRRLDLGPSPAEDTLMEPLKIKRVRKTTVKSKIRKVSTKRKVKK